ncbi:MAG: hypothetical protein JWP75_1625, partial [Frondihabitans sp.]|nr:hypothetical protein [Frondihabitans sp.]
MRALVGLGNSRGFELAFESSKLALEAVDPVVPDV